PLSAWLDTLPSDDLRAAFTRVANVFDSLPPEAISTGRFARGMQTPLEIYYADDPTAPGMSGFTEPYARVIQACGGELLLGQRAVELLVEADRVTGVVLQDDAARVTVLGADAVVFAGVPHLLVTLLGPERADPAFARDAAALRAFENDIALEVRQ